MLTLILGIFILCREIQSGYEIIYKRFIWKTKDGKEIPENGFDHVNTRFLTPEDRDQIKKGYVKIPITRLIHVTHLEAAASISNLESNGFEYVFKSKAKKGKFSATSTHATYVPIDDDNHDFRRLSKDECIFCQNMDCQCTFSWWGIDVGEWYKNEGSEFGEFVSRLESQYIYVADFLHNPPESTYGSQGFSIEFSTLIKRYKQSRTDSESDAEVCFKRGGTLRYYMEIAHVIIVCMGQELPHLKCINSKRGAEVFIHRGLLNEDGEVKDRTKTPKFKISYLIKKTYRPKKDFSWENLVFALYYPNNKRLELKCERKDIMTCAVCHYTPTCHVSGKTELCPDESSYLQLLELIDKHKHCRLCHCGKLNCPKHNNPRCICKD